MQFQWFSLTLTSAQLQDGIGLDVIVHFNAVYLLNKGPLALAVFERYFEGGCTYFFAIPSELTSVLVPKIVEIGGGPSDPPVNDGCLGQIVGHLHAEAVLLEKPRSGL